MSKRNVEVFVAGCPLCDETVKLVKEIACDSCEITVHDLREGCETNECLEKATYYGVNRVPTIVIDGKIADCCQAGPINEADLRAAGLGVAL